MRSKGSKKQGHGKAIDKDTVFTMEKVATELVDKLVAAFPEHLHKTLVAIEPSAGGGAFLPALRKHFDHVEAMDIAPRHELVRQQDFFTFSPNGVGECICWGNPPFSIAKQFLMHAATFCQHIAMILPQRYFQNVP